jgi:TnpA family transposase
MNRKQLAWINAHHVTEDRLNEAIVQVINSYNQFVLPKFWGTGKRASADGTKWNLYEQNLLSEYHIRYGGYGGIGYYHVSDTYIALFSHFIPCGVYEAVHLLDGLIKNTSDIQPDTLHGDTQSQSIAVFGLAYLLGIKLLPRIRYLKDLKLFRADKETRYRHLDALFSETIHWELIETHLPDMLQVVVSIQAGRITPSTILRRLGTFSRKNKLYFAFRELGRVVRTLFLLEYYHDEKLRSTIQAATNKSEEFNEFVKWTAFGNPGTIPENLRHQQRKIIKYNHLVANMLILYNVDEMTRVLSDLLQQGYPITPEVLPFLSPYRKEHINRFGNYVLDVEREVPPLRVDATLFQRPN